MTVKEVIQFRTYFKLFAWVYIIGGCLFAFYSLQYLLLSLHFQRADIAFSNTFDNNSETIWLEWGFPIFVFSLSVIIVFIANQMLNLKKWAVSTIKFVNYLVIMGLFILIGLEYYSYHFGAPNNSSTSIGQYILIGRGTMYLLIAWGLTKLGIKSPKKIHPKLLK